MPNAVLPAAHARDLDELRLQRHARARGWPSAPLLASRLRARLADPLAPAFYIMAYGAAGLALILPRGEMSTRTLDA